MLTRCDDSGLPKIVQSIKFEYNYNTFLCELFNGMSYRVSSSAIYRCDESEPTELNYREVEDRAISYFHYRVEEFRINDKYAKEYLGVAVS